MGRAAGWLLGRMACLRLPDRVYSRAQHIDELAQRVARDDYRRLVLVNNAGVSINSLMELIPLDTWRSQFETNLFGHIAVTQALLPALVGADLSCIVNVSSAAVLLTSPMLGVYAAAKAGLEKSSDALRRELTATRTKVIVVQPGAVRTGTGRRPTWSKTMVKTSG